MKLVPFPIYTKETTKYLEPWTTLPSVLGGFFGLVYPLCGLIVTLLLLGKVVASVITTRTSPVIVATLVDSAIDVLIQVALYWANQLARPEVKAAAREIYPAGRGQLEPVSVVVCAALKCAGMMAVSLQALGDLYAGDPHHGHDHHDLAPEAVSQSVPHTS